MGRSKIRNRVPTTSDGYTSEPTHLRIYREERPDSGPWLLDAADEDGNYAEPLADFPTHRDAVAAMPTFIAEVTADYTPRWRFTTTDEEYDPHGGAKHRFYEEN